MSKIKKCLKCNSYTISDRCKKCNSKTVSSIPAKYSPVDKYAKYRRIAKKEIKRLENDKKD